MRAQNLSEKTKRHRSDYSRRYKEQQRRTNGVPKRPLVAPKRFEGDMLYAWLQKWIITKVELVEEKSIERTFLNGILLSRTDSSYIRRLPGTTPGLEKVDQLAQKYDLPLWEIIEAAGRYKLDKRRKRRKGIKD